jgi:hypothetical protein
MTAILGWLLLGLLLDAGGTHAHHHVRRNFGEWSAARALGATRVKARVSRAIGVSAHRERAAPQAGRCDFQVVRPLNSQFSEAGLTVLAACKR